MEKSGADQCDLSPSPPKSSMKYAEHKPLSHLSQRRGVLFLACIFFVFLQAGLYASHPPLSSPSSPFSTWDPDGRSTDHPIPHLMADAERKYRNMLASQSQSLSAAVAEYKRRYGRNPPRGFDDWWKFAKQNGVIMVDEFDAVVEDMKPFWEISGEELRRRAVQAGELDAIDLVRVRNGNVTEVHLVDGEETPNVSGRAVGLRRMMEKYVDKLPDLDFPVNMRPEGRVLVPWEHRKYPNMTNTNSSTGLSSLLGPNFFPDWRGRGSVWEAYRRTCPPTSPARRLFSSFRDSFTHHASHYLGGDAEDPGDDFSFARGTDAKTDYCYKPWAHHTQGHFYSDFRTIPSLFPIFSPAKAHGFLDIRIPSHYYYGSTPRYSYGWDAVNLQKKDVDPNEVPWEEKEDKLFWRGASMGGGNHPAGFAHQYQRHRFLRMASSFSQLPLLITSATSATPTTTTSSITSYLRIYETAPIPLSLLNSQIMDVAFTKPAGVSSYPGGLEGLVMDHRFDSTAFLGSHWKYKYLLDLDGNAYSARFFSFLASDSVPVKATVYNEWYSDWIRPWLHFIPLTASYKEVYNIHAFFSGGIGNGTGPGMRTVEGERRLRRIARAGKQWKKLLGREVDMEAYVYRVCLEYARLWADDRESMDFVM